MEIILAQLQGDPLTNSAIIAVVAIGVLDFITGTLRAIADKTFAFEYLDVWVRKHLLAAITIILVLGFGRFVGTITVGDVSLSLLTASGLLAAGTFVATHLKSVIDNMNASTTDMPPTT